MTDPVPTSFTIADDGTLRINFNSGQPNDEINKRVSTQLREALAKAGITVKEPAVDGKDMGIVRGLAEQTALFHDDKQQSVSQAMLKIDGDATKPTLLATLAEVLKAPGLMYGHNSDVDPVVTATINREEYAAAQGNPLKLREAANNKVKQSELADNPNDTEWVASDKPSIALSNALDQAKNAVAAIKVDYTAGAAHDGQGQNVRDERGPAGNVSVIV